MAFRFARRDPLPWRTDRSYRTSRAGTDIVTTTVTGPAPSQDSASLATAIAVVATVYQGESEPVSPFAAGQILMISMTCTRRRHYNHPRSQPWSCQHPTATEDCLRLRGRSAHSSDTRISHLKRSARYTATLSCIQVILAIAGDSNMQVCGVLRRWESWPS